MKKVNVSNAIHKALQEARPRTVEEISKAAGMEYNRLSNLRYGKAEAGAAELASLRSVLGLPGYWPDGPEHLGGARPGDLVSLSGVPLMEIPVAGSVSAGRGAWNVDIERRIVMVPSSLAALGSIGFVVDGDSTMDLLEENDTAVFKEARRARKGYIYLLKTPDEGFIVKRMVYDRGDWFLVSLNPKYESKLFPEGGEVHGLLVGFYRVHGRREKIESDADGLLPVTDY